MMKVGQIYQDVTTIHPQNIEHKVISIQRLGCEIKAVEFDTGLIVGEPPFDREWRISFEQFNQEFRLRDKPL
jgi:hypothetical protein